MKLPNNSDVDQCDQPEKSGEARSRGKRVKKKKKKKKATDCPASRAWLSRSSSKIRCLSHWPDSSLKLP